jgi:hypothetical protein
VVGDLKDIIILMEGQEANKSFFLSRNVAEIQVKFTVTVQNTSALSAAARRVACGEDVRRPKRVRGVERTRT